MGEKGYTSGIHPVLGPTSQGHGKGDTPVLEAAPAPQKVTTEEKKKNKAANIEVLARGV